LIKSQTLEEKLAANYTRPCLSIKELAALSGMTIANIGMHVCRKNLDLPCSTTRKRGKKTFYSFSDLAEVLTLRVLAAEKIPLQDHRFKPSSFIVSNNVDSQVCIMAGRQMKNQRFCIFFKYDEDTFIEFQEYPLPSNDNMTFAGPLNAWSVIDCKVLADELLAIFEKYQHKIA
jgi:hypothetical protein